MNTQAKKLLEAVKRMNKLAAVVSITMGPNGRNVILQKNPGFARRWRRARQRSDSGTRVRESFSVTSRIVELLVDPGQRERIVGDLLQDLDELRASNAGRWELFKRIWCELDAVLVARCVCVLRRAAKVLGKRKAKS